MSADPELNAALEIAFRPRSVAVAGVSIRPKATFNGMRWFKLMPMDDKLSHMTIALQTLDTAAEP